jgi:hypothetical protein
MEREEISGGCWHAFLVLDRVWLRTQIGRAHST